MLKRVTCFFICLLLLTGCAAQTAQPQVGYTFTDSTGAEVTAPQKPETVAVLFSSLADLWVTAGGTVDITVGETVERGFADETAVLVDDGAGKKINLELLIASKPDLVIYSSEIAGQEECAEALRNAGIPAAGFRVDTLEEYLDALKICTDILETPENYETYGTELAKRAEQKIAAANEQKQPTVLFVRAGSSAKYTKAKTAENNFVCVMLKELGTVNIAEAAPVLLDGLSTEEIVMADPDFILYTTMGDEESGVAYMESLLSDPMWSTLTAVQEEKVFQLPKDLFQFKPNARWDEAYQYLIDLLYGE